MLALLLVFLVSLPVRVATPQIARLRYYALENGISGGPLSSSLSEFDWRKAFVWRASDTEYRQRQFAQFFEVLTPRLYAHLYYRFGPFLWFPVNLLCVFLIGLMIALLVRQWTGEWGPGLVAGSFWLVTTEVLVGHHAPIRYAKDFATLQILGILALLLSLRSRGRLRSSAAVLGAIALFALGCFTDEYIFFLVPALLIALFSWHWLKGVRWPLALALLLLAGVSVWLYVDVLPSVISPDRRAPFAAIKAASASDPLSLIARNLRYLALNTLDIFAYTFGEPPPRTPIRIALAAGSGAALLGTVLALRAWRGAGRMILFCVLAIIFAGGILLPEGNDILHQHTYYNRPLVALLLVALGIFTARVLAAKRGWGVLWLSALALAAVLNVRAVEQGIRYDPEEAYLTRYGLEDIFDLHGRLKSGELSAPVFVSYPQFRDVVGGVYDELEPAPVYTLENGFPWSLYRTLMPRLYLRHFETGEIRNDPRQFVRWEKADESEYRAECRSFYDMPSGTAWDLEAVRRPFYFKSDDLRWTSARNEIVESVNRRDLLGEAPFAVLTKGRWEAEYNVLAVVTSSSHLSLLFSVRSEGPARFLVENGKERSETELSYRWSWQIFEVPASGLTRLTLVTDGEAQIIGPILVLSAALKSVPPSGRNNAPPSGIPPLTIRGLNLRVKDVGLLGIGARMPLPQGNSN